MSMAVKTNPSWEGVMMKQVAMILGLSLLVSMAESAQIKTVRNYEDVSIKASIKEPNSIMLRAIESNK